MSVSNSGFALRVNGSCQANEVDCGTTVAPYHACCPGSSVCPTQYNVDCCPSAANCTTTLLQDPQCANRTWDLYDNGGFFCCEKGFTGYASTTSSDGCAEPGYAFNNGETLLSIVSAGQAATTSVSSTPATTTPTTPSSPTSTPTSHKSNTGAIAGGVVGGVLGITLIALAVWILFRKRRPSKGMNEKGASTELEGLQKKDRVAVPELAGQHGISEMGGSQGIYQTKNDGRPSELWDPHTASELSG